MADPLEVLTALYRDFGQFCQKRGRVSEADTRASIIDRMLHEVLLWPRVSVSREVHSAPGYLDYELSTTRAVLVVEAKASGESFVIPHQKTTSATRFKISGVLRSNQGLQDALTQAQRYCADRGIRYGVVTNGYSFIVFRGIVEGTPWRAGEAIVFATPKVIETDFATFWKLLSYESVRDGKLDDTFRASGTTPRGHHRPISRVINADATYDRNPINTALRPFVEKYFGDIASQDQLEILEHCYVHSRPLQIIDKDLSMIIHDRIPRFAANAVQIETDESDQGGAIEADLRQSILDRARRAGMVALLMGGIGSGKTTFLKRFFAIVARDLVAPNGPAVLARLEFLGAPDEPTELDRFVWARLAEIFRAQDPSLSTRGALEELAAEQIELIRQAYGHTADAERKINDAIFGFGTDAETFSKEVLKRYLRRGRMPIIVFDNVDQLGVGAQTWIFTTSERFANHLGCVTILVMREESYCVAQLRKQLTAYTIRPYHLSSPGFRDMIRVRIDFATRHAAELRAEQRHGEAEKYREIIVFFDVLRRSVFDKNRNISRLIEAVSFGNMRIALDLFNNFITSGATNTPEVLARFRHSGSYSVPFHQFAKSVILGDYRYYKESRSLVLNLFDVTEARNSSHFTALRILSCAAGSVGAPKTAEGFMDLQVVVNTIMDVFDNEEDVVRSMLKLIELGRQLLELDTRRCDSLEGASSVRVTSAGQYYMHYLAKSFAYLDLVWHDTPMNSLGVCDSLSRLIAETDMRTRFRRVETFLSYLDEEEQMELKEANLPQTGSSVYGPFMARIRRQYEKEKVFIQRRFARAGQAL